MNNNWYSFSVTDVGKKRSVNQDAIYADDEKSIWLVADGMGGHRDGDKASQAIVATLKKMTFSNLLSERIIEIEKALRILNTQLQNYSNRELNGQHIGSTIVLLTVCQGICAVLWAGDSRCYRVRQNTMEQMSWDHSYIDEMLRSGHIVEEEAATSKLSNIITRAVGAHEALYFDHILFPFSEADTFVLCSDGLTNELTDDKISRNVVNGGCSQQSVDVLLNETLAHGAKDNVSIVLVSSKQRRISDNNEAKLLANHSKKINQLATRFFEQDVAEDAYYNQIADLLESAVNDHSSYKGQNTVEAIKSLKTEEISIELPTANYPKIDQPNDVKANFDLHYILLVVAVVLVSAILMYFVLS